MSTGLPIIVGVERCGELDEPDAQPLLSFFEAELRARRQAYPHSPLLLLLPRTADALLSVLTAAAAAVDARITRIVGADASGGDPGELDPLAGDCHLLIRVTRASGRGNDRLAPGVRRDGTAGEVRPVGLEARYQVELIEVLLPADRSSPAYSVSRSWITGIEVSPAVSGAITDKALRRTEQFNRDAQALQRRTRSAAERPAPLIPPGIAASEPCARLHGLFTVADELSNLYQIKVTRAFQSIFAVAMLAAVLYGLFLIYGSGDRPLQEYLLAPYLALLLGAYAVYYGAKRADLYDRFVEYRALAEGARVQLYWLACGADGVVTDDYFAAHAVELHWIRVALRFASPSPTQHPPAQAADPGRTAQALRYWITREKGYYTRSSARSVRIQKWSIALVRILFICGGCTTLLVLFQSQIPIAPLLKRIALASFLCPSVAAAVVALVNKLGVLYRAEHHSRMLALYAQAGRYLDRSAPAQAMSLADALGQAALRESEEWTVFRRERRIDEPASPFRRPW